MVDWRLILLLLLLGLMWLVYTRLQCPRSAAPSRPVSITVHRPHLAGV
jgi:hypothetical protein